MLLPQKETADGGQRHTGGPSAQSVQCLAVAPIASLEVDLEGREVSLTRPFLVVGWTGEIRQDEISPLSSGLYWKVTVALLAMAAPFSVPVIVAVPGVAEDVSVAV